MYLVTFHHWFYSCFYHSIEPYEKQRFFFKVTWSCKASLKPKRSTFARHPNTWKEKLNKSNLADLANSSFFYSAHEELSFRLIHHKCYRLISFWWLWSAGIMFWFDSSLTTGRSGYLRWFDISGKVDTDSHWEVISLSALLFVAPVFKTCAMSCFTSIMELWCTINLSI